MPALRPPAGLSDRGKRLFRDLTGSVDLGPAALVLVEEACRTADRLDRLDAALRGEASEWLSLRESHRADGGALVLVVNGLLAEARQQQNALRQILATLEVAKAKALEAQGQEADPLDEIRRARERRSGTAGL